MAELDTSQSGGKKKGKKHGGKKMSTRVDLTPMVDLAFLLVTFFMLTTTFSKPQTMEINMPVKDKETKEEGQAVKASKALSILLGADNKVYYYLGIEDPELMVTGFDKDGIRKVLNEKNRTIRDLIVIIKATKDAKYKNVVDILDEMAITDVKKYALVDITDFDLELIEKANL
ncbi:MAG: biopolymer transporter ExbD [Ignavibacteriaceae bacterium]|nr:biopolymer transporter ExbD [Ignavibacteriaceae bacterium]